jgi:hypothetical protein
MQTLAVPSNSPVISQIGRGPEHSESEPQNSGFFSVQAANEESKPTINTVDPTLDMARCFDRRRWGCDHGGMSRVQRVAAWANGCAASSCAEIRSNRSSRP